MGNSPSQPDFATQLATLLSGDVKETEEKFWDNLWAAPVNSDDIMVSLNPTFLRQLRAQRRQNFATLVRMVRIFQ